MHGVRKGIQRGVACPMGKGMCFTSWNAAEAAKVRLGAERVYRCGACGYLHITRYTEGEYSQRMAATAEEGCTSGIDYGIVVVTDEGGNREGQAAEASDRGQPRPGSRDAGEASQSRGGRTRLAPSPATLARFLEERSDPRRGR